MIALIQRVSHAQVTVDGKTVGQCGKGLLIFLGVAPDDSSQEVSFLCRKIAAMRIFEDEQGKMNRSLHDIDGEVLAVSQFTLCADLSHGNRPSFTSAAPPAAARELYEAFLAEMNQHFPGKVSSGVFGADMKVSLCNDGPVTFWLDTHELMNKKQK